jgi:hypothetical protein
MLKLVLRLELPLLERPGLPVENEARSGEEGSTGDGKAGGEGADDPLRPKVIRRKRNYIRFRRHMYHFRFGLIHHSSVHIAPLTLLSSSDYPSVVLLVRRRDKDTMYDKGLDAARP